MCTAVSYKGKKHYFGRNLDLERSYGEGVVITPRSFRLRMRCVPDLSSHYAIIGMAAVIDGYPLYFDGTNEKGLSMAGLNFPDNAVYYEPKLGAENITPFELIPYVLGKCRDIKEAVSLLGKINIVNIPFDDKLALSPLHWLVSDKEKSFTVESLREGLRIYENPYEVLTNNPPFDFHLTNINNYMSLHESFAENHLSKDKAFYNYSLGMGALGLPGDFSSASRFVKAIFVKEKSVPGENEKEDISQFFHILSSVSMPKGSVMTRSGEYEYTRYTCCCDTEKGIYYYTTYNNSSPKAVDLFGGNLESNELYIFSKEQ